VLPDVLLILFYFIFSIFPMKKNEGIQKGGWVFRDMPAFFFGRKISLDTQNFTRYSRNFLGVLWVLCVDECLGSSSLRVAGKLCLPK
jgi:hypothetical protein